MTEHQQEQKHEEDGDGLDTARAQLTTQLGLHRDRHRNTFRSQAAALDVPR